MTLDTIAVAIGQDGSVHAQHEGIVSDIAGPAAAEVVLVHVFSEDEYGAAVENLDFDSKVDSTPDRTARRHAEIGELSETLEEEGIAYEIRGVVGDDPGEALVEFAETEDVDLFIVGGKSRSPAGKAIFGSAAQKLALNAPCPVTLAREE
jgi:nucleotide-binding universal stress UspA family protein